MVATVRQAKKVMTALKAERITVSDWFQDGPGDSIKIEVTVADREFLIAVEAPDDLPVMDPKGNWTYGHTSVLAAIEQIRSYRGG